VLAYGGGRVRMATGEPTCRCDHLMGEYAFEAGANRATPASSCHSTRAARLLLAPTECSSKARRAVYAYTTMGGEGRTRKTDGAETPRDGTMQVTVPRDAVTLDGRELRRCGSWRLPRA
jgi:hypothetical protein